MRPTTIGQERGEEPRDRDEVARTYHCKVCCEEFEAMVGEFDDPDVECGQCGRLAVLGELEPGECAVCGLTRDSGQVALGNWYIEEQTDMTCSSCTEENA